MYESQLINVCFLAANNNEALPLAMKDKAAYSHDVRIWTYALLNSNTATGMIPEMLKRKFGTNTVPNRSSVERMAIELGVLPDLQVCNYVVYIMEL